MCDKAERQRSRLSGRREGTVTKLRLKPPSDAPGGMTNLRYYTAGFNTTEQNAAAKRAYPDRFILNGAFDPRDEERGLDDLQGLVENFKIRGVNFMMAEDIREQVSNLAWVDDVDTGAPRWTTIVRRNQSPAWRGPLRSMETSPSEATDDSARAAAASSRGRCRRPGRISCLAHLRLVCAGSCETPRRPHRRRKPCSAVELGPPRREIRSAIRRSSELGLGGEAVGAGHRDGRRVTGHLSTL